MAFVSKRNIALMLGLSCVTFHVRDNMKMQLNISPKYFKTIFLNATSPYMLKYIETWPNINYVILKLL